MSRRVRITMPDATGDDLAELALHVGQSVNHVAADLLRSAVERARRPTSRAEAPPVPVPARDGGAPWLEPRDGRPRRWRSELWAAVLALHGRYPDELANLECPMSYASYSAPRTSPGLAPSSWEASRSRSDSPCRCTRMTAGCGRWLAGLGANIRNGYAARRDGRGRRDHAGAAHAGSAAPCGERRMGDLDQRGGTGCHGRRVRMATDTLLCRRPSGSCRVASRRGQLFGGDLRLAGHRAPGTPRPAMRVGSESARRRWTGAPGDAGLAACRGHDRPGMGSSPEPASRQPRMPATADRVRTRLAGSHAHRVRPPPESARAHASRRPGGYRGATSGPLPTLPCTPPRPRHDCRVVCVCALAGMRKLRSRHGRRTSPTPALRGRAQAREARLSRTNARRVRRAVPPAIGARLELPQIANSLAARAISRSITPVTVYLTVREVATMARCEHKAVRRAIAAGRLRAFRPTNRLLIREDDASAWIEGRPVAVTVPPSSPRRATGRSGRTRQSQRPGSVADLREIERKAV